jgi:uncharacterized protein YacL
MLRPGVVITELIRLSVVLLLTGLGYLAGPAVTAVVDGFYDQPDVVEVRFVTSVLGALFGYVLGGGVGRAFVTGVDRAEERLRRVEASVLLAGAIGAAIAGVLGALVLWPILLLPVRTVGVAVAVVLFAIVLYTGGRLGAARGGELLRYVGARGRVEVTTPSRGHRTKLVDTSALIDGRLVDVTRAGFLDGTLVVPRFVLDELQGLADAEDRRRRDAGRRGLDTLRTLQDEAVAAVEVTDDDDPTVSEVDAKLAALARERGAALLTVDANLARVAEISGVRVLNLHELAEALRPPVIPGDRVSVTVTKEGREAGQGVGYLPDGTMVVIERAADRVGAKVDVEVTSLLQSRNGRMIFAQLVGDGP